MDGYLAIRGLKMFFLKEEFLTKLVHLIIFEWTYCKTIDYQLFY
jgi:hypothetical protein